MKKAFLFLCTFLTFVTFQQCVEENVVLNNEESSNLTRLASIKVILPSESDFMEEYSKSFEFKNFLDKYRFHPDEYFELKTAGEDCFFAAKLTPQKMSVSTKEYFLVIYPNYHSAKHKAIIFEQELGNTTAKLTVFDAKSYTWIAEGEFRLDGSGQNKAIDRACADTTNSFGECFSCSWNHLTNDALGTVACATNPWSCAAAATIHCASHI